MTDLNTPEHHRSLADDYDARAAQTDDMINRHQDAAGDDSPLIAKWKRWAKNDRARAVKHRAWADRLEAKAEAAS